MNSSDQNNEFIEIINAGALKVGRVALRKSAIIAVLRPTADNFGCILQLEDGSKFPAVEKYEDVIQQINKHNKGDQTK